LNDDLLIRDRSDPLYEDATPPRTRRYAHHLIPLSDEPFTKTELSEIRSRRNDEVFPPLTRLWVLIKIRTGAGRRPYRLTNVEAEEIGLSRWQKYVLVQRLEAMGRVTVRRSIGCSPLVSLGRGVRISKQPVPSSK
jgi:hypothetical protein